MSPWLMLGALAIAVTATVAAWFHGQHIGYGEANAEHAQAALVQAANVQRLEREAARLTSEIGRISAEHTAEIRTVTRTIIQKVPVYVTRETDARFPLAWGFVRLHDAAALNITVPAVPLPAGKSDGDASPVTASFAAGIIVANYGQANEARQQLIDLQGWVKAQQEVRP